MKGENGAVEGIINWSIGSSIYMLLAFVLPLILYLETTKKVIAERRLLTLRTMGERAKLSKNVQQLTSALLSVLEQNKQE